MHTLASKRQRGALGQCVPKQITSVSYLDEKLFLFYLKKRLCSCIHANRTNNRQIMKILFQ